MSEALNKAMDALYAHARRHKDHDDHDGYEGSDLQEQTDTAITAIYAALAQPPAPTAQPSAQPSATLTELIAGALYDLMGDLTTRNETLRLGAFELATPACDALDAFAKKRGLSLDNPAIENWATKLATAQPANLADEVICPSCSAHFRAIPTNVQKLLLSAGYEPPFMDAKPVQQPGAEPLQGGMDNAELLAAWKKKLPSVEPSDAQLTAFAVGVEVGFSHARDLERQDWSRVHHALAKHGAHPGRTDGHLADVIDRALAAPAQRQPLTAEAVFASKDFMSMNGLYWGLGIETLMQIVRVTERECAAAWGVTLAAQKGEKL